MGSKIVKESKRGIGKNVHRLNSNTQIFVDALMADNGFNAVNAAREAGYKNPSAAAYRLMKNPIVAKAIGKAIHDRRTKLGVKAERVMEELLRIGYFNPKALFDKGGTLKDITALPDEVACCIQSMDVQTRTFGGDDGMEETVTTVKIRFWDKLQALDMLCKHLGFYVAQKADVEIDLKGLLPALIERVSQRNNVLDTSAIQRAINGPTGPVGAHNPTIIEVPTDGQ